MRYPALLRVDMPEVDREVREQRVHLLPWLLPGLPARSRKGMTKRWQAQGAPASSGHDGHALAQPRKPVVEGTLLPGLPPFRHAKRLG